MVAVTPASIITDFEEMEGSPTESVGEDGRFRATQRLKCLWANRFALANELFGHTSLIVPGGMNLDVTLPAEYAHKTGVFVKSIPTIQGFGGGGDYNRSGAGSRYTDYEHAILTVEYEVPLFDINTPNSGPRIEETLEPEAEFITVGVHNLVWETDLEPLDINEAPGIQQRKMTWVYRISGIPTLPLATINLLGRCNSTNIFSRKFGWSFQAGTLLYQAPVLTRYFYAGGQASAWDVVYRFSFDPGGWNRFHRPGTLSKERIVVQIFGRDLPYEPYPPDDFTQIVFQ